MNDTQIVGCLLKMHRGSIVNFKVGKKIFGPKSWSSTLNEKHKVGI